MPSELGIEIYVRNKRPADERIPTRAYGPVRARRRLSRPHFVRSQARRHVVDGRAATTSISSTFAATAPKGMDEAPEGQPADGARHGGVTTNVQCVGLERGLSR